MSERVRPSDYSGVLGVDLTKMETLETVPPISLTLDEALQRVSPAPSPAALASLRRISSSPADESWRGYLADTHRRKLAAVLVMLSIDEEGQLQVTLTTRALTLRTSPGETAFPGGRVEPEDATVLDTAVCRPLELRRPALIDAQIREAQEEIGLPLNAPLLPLTTLPAFLSYTLLLVIPCIVLLAAPASTIFPQLVANPAEVDAIFHARLSSFLGVDETYTHSAEDTPWIAETPFRLHAFRHESFASPVTGLTAEMLVRVALLAGGQEAKTAFEHEAPGQLPWLDAVEYVLAGKQAAPRRRAEQ